jgi:ubiquinone/menaquinone biosynthesis C-methylase UbiE
MSLRTSYRLIAPIYDACVRSPLEEARRTSLAGLPTSPKGRVLLVGVGTGLDLPHLPDVHDYVGVDLTRAMLHRATQAPAAGRVRFVEGDAMRLPFAAASFDHAVLHLILAVVPDPLACLRETARVVRRTGTVLVFDKFLRPGRRAWLRRTLTPITGSFATRLDVVFEELLAQVPELEVLADRPGPARGWFRLIRLRRM